MITATEPLSRSFGYIPGKMLDVDAAIETIIQRLSTPTSSRRVTLKLIDDPTVPQVDLDRLQNEVEALAEEWDGVVGFHLSDLASGEAVALNEDTVFAGASTIKAAIMLNAYVNLKRFDAQQEEWLKEMIVESDNLAANDLLAAATGSRGTEAAFVGAEQMSDMLAENLGLKNTYLFVPYEAGDFIRINNFKFRCGPQDPVGPAPYTETGCALRATPADMARLYRLIDACAEGEGELLAQFELLSAKRCQEMLDRLARNGDETRMVAGVPEDVRVEHKSGWVGDMQADAGIVRSPNGDYVLAVYIFKALPKDLWNWPDEMLAPVVAHFSRLAYTAYNPVKIEE
ncbi:serine hydrolase [Candidatus Gracilibacteria bacterium]|nr:serine hydrolase [Candidatus Gracilibacteria bacterium]